MNVERACSMGRVAGAGRVVCACAAAAVLGLTAGAARADVRLPEVLGDGMVLQRDAEVPIWGWASPGERVSVSASWMAKAAAVPAGGGQAAGTSALPVGAAQVQADRNGRWVARIRTPGAGGPFTVTVNGNNSVTLTDVLVGEVWLASGQSNMEMPLGNVGPGYTGVKDAEREIAEAKYPRIRMFTVKNEIALQPRYYVASADGKGWAKVTPENARTMSATAYYFAREIQGALDVPVGIIAADWGGTVAEAWTSMPALRAGFAEFNGALDTLNKLADPNTRGEASREFVDGWWDAADKRAGGPGAGWATAEFNDAGWSAATLPGVWAGDLGQFDGFGYYRKSIDLPASAFENDADAEWTLELGPIDDRDDAFVNGVLVGGTRADGRWNQNRVYAVAKGVLKPGRNVVGIRMLDTAGPGGVHGKAEQMKLSRAGGVSVPLAGEWRFFKGAAMKSMPAIPESLQLGPNWPGVLFNAMIAPVSPYGIRGAIWYQGESNRARAGQYAKLLPAMIEDWRKTWNQPGEGRDFPFYFVQIAPYGYQGDVGQTSELREAQLMAMRSTKNTGMAVTMDIGDAGDIHPTNKAEVGRRLSLWALAKTYGRQEAVKGGEYSGPLYVSAKAEGAGMRVRFEHARGLKASDGGALTEFWIAGADKQFYVGDARVDGESVVVSSSRVSAPVAVRYAWGTTATGNLVNAAGLPASSFRTDDWAGPMKPVADAGKTRYLTSEEGFSPLFNGKDLAGWVNVNCAPETWSVRSDESGTPIIYCTGKPTGLLRTEKQYENFVLEMEWRHMVPGGNAGLFVWADALPVRGQPFTRAVEVQVMDGPDGSWYTTHGDVFAIFGSTLEPENPGSAKMRAYPTEKRSLPSPQWNHYRVECKDGEISLAVNGKVVTRAKNTNPRRGFIHLESEGTEIHFRNIKIKELPSKGRTPAEAAGERMVEEASTGFVPMYTGVDFAGWKFGKEHEGHWRATDWSINFDGQGADLWTEKSYRDFILIADWRWAGKATEVERPVILPDGSVKKDAAGKDVTQKVMEAGDSGIYLRGNSKSQVNIWCWPAGSGEVYGYRTDAAMPAEVRAGVTPKMNADAPIGEWNRFVITMKGDRLTVSLNGKTVIENAQLPGVPREGPIALQMHGGALQFANLYIKELKE
jgi:sialate O-acetylesterase